MGLYPVQHPFFCLVHPCHIPPSAGKVFSPIVSWPVQNTFGSLMAKENRGPAIFEQAQAWASGLQSSGLLIAWTIRTIVLSHQRKPAGHQRSPQPSRLPGGTLLCNREPQGVWVGGRELESILVPPLVPSSALPWGQSRSGFCHQSCLLS